MKIEFKKSFYGCDLIIEADNVKISEDVEERIYSKDENGKTIMPPKRDVDTSFIEMFSNVMSDIIYYREKEFDSTQLIENLFEKLSISDRETLLSKLNNAYAE